MEKIYEHSNDIHVANYVVFYNGIAGGIYSDAAFKNELAISDVKDAFAKGRLVVDLGEGSSAVPVAITASALYIMQLVSDAATMVDVMAAIS